MSAMGTIWKRTWILLIFYPLIISSISLDSFYLDLIHQNISDSNSFTQFYKDLLKDVRQHRSIDTVSSPIDVDRILADDYDTNYLRNSCYESATDLLRAHGYNQTDTQLSITDLQSLLPAVLYSIENPGCERQLPVLTRHTFFDVWIFGVVLIMAMKAIHLLVFLIAGDHSSALTSSGISRSISDHQEKQQASSEEVSFPPIRYHLWLGLGFNAFTCGIILGTIIYHLIPHIYEVPNEDFNYTYLFRGTVILFGIFLFFIVEKLLRFRFKVDETSTDEPVHTAVEATELKNMAEKNEDHHKHSNVPVKSSTNVDSADEETSLQADQKPVTHNHHSAHHHQRRNLLLYHIIYDFSNDIIYGCGLSTALAHDRLTALVLWILIFSEGFRRHSQLKPSFGRKYAMAFIFVSFLFLLLGYVLGGIIIEINENFNFNIIYLQKEYIYSILYGALFYTGLVTLIPELNDFGQHLQTVVKTVNQTSKERRLLKTLILICQNLFLIIGVLVALVLAIIWRYYHRRSISQYVCQRDPSRLFCHSSS